MKLIRQATLIAWMILSALFSNAQQDHINLQRINPAYVGSWKTIGLTGSSKMILPIKGNPLEYAFSFQAPLDSLNSGIGVSMLNLVTGLENRLLINIDYSYHISLTDQTLLRFGIKGGIKRYSNNFTDYELYPGSKPDPDFAEDNYHYTTYNLGIGVYLSSQRYYLSLSVPEITTNDFKPNSNSYSSIINPNLFFTGGTIINLSNFVKVKPIFMVQTFLSQNASQYDFSTHFLLCEKVWIGGMIRSNDMVGTSTQLILGKKFRIGYSYDFHINNDIRKFQRGINEIMLSYEIPISKSDPISVRYF